MEPKWTPKLKKFVKIRGKFVTSSWESSRGGFGEGSGWIWGGFWEGFGGLWEARGGPNGDQNPSES